MRREQQLVVVLALLSPSSASLPPSQDHLRYFPSYSQNSSSWTQQAEGEGAYTLTEEGRSYGGVANLAPFPSLYSLPSRLYETITGEQGEGRLAVSGINTSTVYSGVFDPNNILIHVTQNLVNFIAGTIAWMVFIPMYQGSRREGRALEGDSWLSWLSEHSHQVPWALRRIADTADIISQFREDL